MIAVGDKEAAIAAVRARAFRVYEQDDEKLGELARWLVSMDDPEDAAGLEERRSVTLTRIIERAREALGRERLLVHSRRSGIGADWDLANIETLIESAYSVEWIRGAPFGHELRVENENGVVWFDVKTPETAA